MKTSIAASVLFLALSFPGFVSAVPTLLYSGKADKCLQVDTLASGSQNAVTSLQTCDKGNVAQLFEYNFATKKLMHSGKCLDGSPRALEEPNPSQPFFWDCNSASNHQWNLNSGHHISSGDSICLGVSGSTINYHKCLSSEEVWSLKQLTNVMSGPGLLYSGKADKCLQVDTLAAGSENAVTSMQTCDQGNANQLFQYDSATFHLTHSGKCLDGSTRGSHPFFWECNGQYNHVWYFSADAPYFHSGQIMCLGTSGSRINNHACAAQNEEQWSFRPSTESPTAAPSTKPSAAPSTKPSAAPSTKPSTAPSPKPSTSPSSAPSVAPVTTAPSSAPKEAAKGSNVGSGSAQRGPMKGGVRGSNSGASNGGKGNKSAVSKGDPHFKTFAGKKFDFHGGCDLVLLHHPEFANKLGLDINMRTKINSWWSYIDSAVIRIGSNKLEVSGGTDGGKFWFNGKPRNTLEHAHGFTLSGFVVHIKQSGPHQKQYRVDLGYRNAISFDTYKDFVSVNVNVKYDKHLIGSRGLMGSYPDGNSVGRDGMTIMEDPIVFGKEWQVLDSEPMLFHSVEGPQHPKACAMPSSAQDDVATREKRRLGEAGMTKEDAEIACAHADPEEKKACIFDVLATQDTDFAVSY